jgi:Domain of unknown function (DUF4105)
MKKILIVILFFLTLISKNLFSQTVQDTSIYLITCSPGTETYSIYGHSAIRVVISHLNSDTIYNWGVFDFSTPNFIWKFAKGRLNYFLDTSEFQRFMSEYYYEKRSVFSQKINLESSEKRVLLSLIQVNRLPENRSYRYDFFYDDCSTRIRDLIEKAVGTKLIYPPEEKRLMPSFRDLVGEYQKSYPWLKMGVDLIMGTPGEVKSNFRDMMFLPLYLQKNLTMAVINRDHKMTPLLSSRETLLEFDPQVVKEKFYTTPIFIFTLLFIIIVFLSVLLKKGRIINVLDILLFAVFSVLSVLMIFFNFFSDHLQMKLNLNIVWFNPAVIVCLFCLIFRKIGEIWFRIVFFLALVFFPLILTIPSAINSSFVPIMMILILRSSARGNFGWNPFSVHE